MKHFKAIVVTGLCASLVLNYTMFLKLKVLDNQVKGISSFQHEVIRTVRTNASNISSDINKIKEEQSWLSPVDVRVIYNEKDKSKTEVKFEWQVKELEKNSQVFLNYKMNKDDEYISLKATPKGNGSFVATIPVEVELEPNWNILVAHTTVSEKQMRVQEEQKEAFERNRLTSFDYYISVSQRDMIKSSEANIARIDNVGARYYGDLDVRIEFEKNNTYSVMVVGGRGYYKDSAYLKEAYLKKYKNGTLIDEEKLDEEKVVNEGKIAVREGAKIFNTVSSKEEFYFDKLMLKVVYSDGSIFEREVYRK